MNQLRRGEFLTALASLVLLATLFLRWYDTDAAGARDAHTRGWTALGVGTVVVLAIAIGLGLALAATTLTRRSPALPVALGVLTWVWAALAWCVLVIRLLVEPDLGIGLSGEQVTLQLAGWVGLVAATLLPVAALMTLKDERTDAPESAYTPPEPRPVPDGEPDAPQAGS